MSRRQLAAIVAALGALAAAESRACAGTLNEYIVYSDGTLMVFGSWRGDWTYLCSTQGTLHSISSETCFSWLAMATAARVHNKTFGVYYAGSLNCATLPTYSGSPAPMYVRVGS
jgi:hypothetical protein